VSWYHLIKNWNAFVASDGPMPHNPYPHLTFLFAAREITPILEKPVASVRESCRLCGVDDYDIKVVAVRDGVLGGAEHVIVPVGYKCLSRFKARQLHYALGFISDSPNVWILHLDEDAKVTSQTVRSVLKYIKDGGKPVANGPSFFPYDGGLLPFYTEAHRHWTFYWLKDQMDTSAVHWMNGSNMLVRSDIEHAIGWSFKNLEYSEDTRFAYEASKRFGDVFGWHGGVTIEKPPKDVMAVIRQRKRWFWGGLVQLRHASGKGWPRRLYSSLSWLLGFVLTALLLLGLLPFVHVPLVTLPFATVLGVPVVGILWLARYQLALYQNLKYTTCSNGRRVLHHLWLALLTPVVELICTVSVVLAVVWPPRGFYVTEKRGEEGCSQTC